MTLSIEGIPCAQNDKFEKNDKVFLRDTNEKFGTVRSVTYGHKPHINSETGVIEYYYPELINVEIIIECKATAGEDYIDVNGGHYAVSDVIQFYAPNFIGEGKITSYEVTE